VLEKLQGYSADICILAGYLLILSPALVTSYRFINLHPALPGGPVGLWQKVIWELIDARAAQTGNMTLEVTDELDRGTQLTYDRVALVGPAFDGLWAAIGGASAGSLKMAAGEDHPLFKAIREASVKREPYLIVETLKALANGTLGSDGPLDLTDRVEAALAGDERSG
jgi:hypothetical protein